MVLPRGFVHQSELAAEVEKAKKKLGPHVLRVKHSVGEDMSGEPAVYFRIVMTDASFERETLVDVTRQISNSLFDDLQPYENWGLTPYFNFRSESDQAKSSDIEWA